ncbi:hypothetical protein [Kribbella sp. C-35]|uniref:hypothetical protein n=1 Tax=Kribbella sp. C-35 TaxID=2789276 RepID=UPI00397959C1
MTLNFAQRMSGVATLTSAFVAAIEVEVTTAEEAREALDCQVEWILLDNMPVEQMALIVERRNTSRPTPLPHLTSVCW